MTRPHPFVLVASFFMIIAQAEAKCLPPDYRKVVWTREIDAKALPAGVEVVDRVWLRNSSSTELILYTPEKGAALRTNYREILGAVPTTADELPGTKLVNGERYEYHFPANPQYSTDDRVAQQGGWVPQDYAAGLVQVRAPELPANIQERIFAGKSAGVALRVPVPVYYGKKRTAIKMVFEYSKNPKYGIVDPACPPAKP